MQHVLDVIMAEKKISSFFRGYSYLLAFSGCNGFVAPMISKQPLLDLLDENRHPSIQRYACEQPDRTFHNCGETAIRSIVVQKRRSILFVL